MDDEAALHGDLLFVVHNRAQQNMKRKADARDETPFDQAAATRKAKKMGAERLKTALASAGVHDTDGTKTDDTQ